MTHTLDGPAGGNTACDFESASQTMKLLLRKNTDLTW